MLPKYTVELPRISTLNETQAFITAVDSSPPVPPSCMQMIFCSTRILVQPVLPFISIDGPFPGRVAETIVVVNILDMNDHAPTLFQTHYSAYVFENAAVNSTILTVYASDLDKVGKKIFKIYLRELREKLCS